MSARDGKAVPAGTRAGTEPSLYDQVGGAPAVRAALDRFYEKVLADPRLQPFFDGLDVERIKARQQRFLAEAFGGPSGYDGRDLRAAHRRAVAKGLNEAVYEVFMAHFRDTLGELDVAEPTIVAIMEIANGGRDEVLNR